MRYAAMHHSVLSNALCCYALFCTEPYAMLLPGRNARSHPAEGAQSRSRALSPYARHMPCPISLRTPYTMPGTDLEAAWPLGVKLNGFGVNLNGFLVQLGSIAIDLGCVVPQVGDVGSVVLGPGAVVRGNKVRPTSTVL
eukprot:2183788-Rhodomonas_salina.5